MNNIRQCRRCRKLFNFIASPYCPRCVEEIDREYRLVRDFIYDNPHAGIKEIAEATEVGERTILDLLREGRLELDKSISALSCERCGTGIASGRYCESCQNNLSSELRQAQQSFGKQDEQDSRSVDKRQRNDDRNNRDHNERMHSRNS